MKKTLTACAIATNWNSRVSADEIANRPKSAKHGTFRKLGCINLRRDESAPRAGDRKSVEIEDRELVTRVLAGRTDDFRLLVERHQASVFRFALALLGNRQEAEDIVQEAF